MLKERLPKEVRLNGTCSSGADDDRNDRVLLRVAIHISQGSVTTCLKRGGIFKHEFVANLLPSRLVKKFENRIITSEVMAKSLVSCFS